ncbi:IclR-family transcriptional regulator [Escherichia coli]|uniref:IclR-family transcriptional regulator n=1 Tax=Escherichia coli TaxID=562 RepID=A0A2X3JI82_ECOLX|nr:IclR-family transcriptional regulator [Escherichia coli]
MYNLRMYSRIGRRNPLYSTAIGKVLLAWRDLDEVKQILEGVEYKRQYRADHHQLQSVITRSGPGARAGVWRR